MGEWWMHRFVELAARVVEELHQFASLDGVLLASNEFVLLFPLSMCLIWIIFAILFVLFRETRRPGRADSCLSVAAVVPAHNEELVIAGTIESLLEQNLPELEIHVVSDGSTDRTVEIARRFESSGVKVHSLRENGGKSAALQRVLDLVKTDLFLIVDADTHAHPGAVRQLLRSFSDPRVAGVTGNPYVRNIRNPILAMQAMEYSSIIGLIKRADGFWGGLFTVSGAAACFRTAVLRQVGGWSMNSITEDIEMSWRLQHAGHLLRYDPGALFAIQAPASLGALYRQRIRWAQGSMQVLRKYGDISATLNPVTIPIMVQVLGTALWMFLMICHLFAAIGAWAFSGLAAPGVEPLNLLIAAVTTSGMFAAQALAASVFESHYRSRVLRLTPLALLYPLYYWIIIAPCYVLGTLRGLRGCPAGGRWRRTTRTLEDQPGVMAGGESV